MSSYTYVSYCTDDSPGLAELKAAYQLIEFDYLERKEAMTPQAALAMERRVEALRLAWAGLLEPVPCPWGG